MNAPAKIEEAKQLLPAVNVLEIRAQLRAYFWWVYAMEIDEAVDELQAYAERTALVDLIGQDAVQAIIAAPFERYRKRIEPEEIPLQPKPEPPQRRAYRPPQATIDAFKYVAATGDVAYLRQWLGDRPKDTPFLLAILESQISC
jgi:hypothetical protein